MEGEHDNLFWSLGPSLHPVGGLRPTAPAQAGALSGGEYGCGHGCDPARNVLSALPARRLQLRVGVPAPEFDGINEVCPIRAGNGNIVATCRTDPPEKYRTFRFDHYEGFGVSISRDNGYTWSKVNQLYDWGRHHASTVLLPDGAIVVTYVVRLGYPDTADGFPQFGIEAVVSHDNGETWDLDHRYVLSSWVGNKKGTSSPADKQPSGAWQAGSHTTSSLLLPDGSILTAYGTGYRQQEEGYEPGQYGPRDVELVKWTIDT